MIELEVLRAKRPRHPRHPLILGVTGLESSSVEIVQAVIWACLAMAVIVADAINDWSELRCRAPAGTVGARRLALTGDGRPVSTV